MAAWFTGSREGAGDVSIVISTLSDCTWTPPQIVANPQLVEHDTQRLIRKLGNPVLWRSPDNVLHMWFVSVSYGGWAGSAINHMESIDDGVRWSRIERVVTSPFWNLSTLVRSPPLPLSDGGLALPVYHEFLFKRPEWLRIDAHMMVVDRARVNGSVGTLQPAAVALDKTDALMLMRDSGDARRIHRSATADIGKSWLPATTTAIPNPNSAIALIKLSGGALLLACNPAESNRNVLALLLSRDSGKTWTTPHVIESGGVDDEFSYPALLQDDAGVVHLAYTWKRELIKHIVVPQKTIEGLH